MDPRLVRILRLAAAGSVAAASLAMAQTESAAPPPAVVESQPPAPLPPPPEIGPAAEPPPPIAKPRPSPRPVDHAAAVVAPPPPPPTVLRSPVAVLQVLDKVTAETLRFEAPVGRRIRYKTLLIDVRACETRGYKDAEPRASAYLVVNTRVAPVQGSREPTMSEVFHGWTFAQTPSLHPLEHPIYDLWLVACSASAPAA